MSLDEARRRLTPEGSPRPYAYHEDAALEQLARIAASLDSLNPGEDQIMAQVRAAFAEAKRKGRAGSTLSFAFHTALKIAKRVRREVVLAPVNTSLFSLARPELAARLPQGAAVTVVGAGEMGSIAARTLASSGVGLTIVNRNVERAHALARSLGAASRSLEGFLARPHPADALVCATPVGGFVDEELLERLPGLRMIVDLGVPRNVRPEVAARRGIHVLDVDTLQEAGEVRRCELAGQLALAERTIQEGTEAAVTEWAEARLGPSIKRLREMYLATIGDVLPPDEAEQLAHRFAHVPVKGLRAVAREHGFEAAKTFLAETGLME